MIPILFNKDEKTFTSLGLGQMDAALVEVERERNGNYTLYAEVPFSSPQAKQLTKEMLIKADAGSRTKWQTFKINRTIKDTNADVIKVYADHISMDTINDAMKPKVVIRQQTAEGALRQWANSLVSGKAYDVQSDITYVGSTEWTIDEVENARQALGGVEGSILDVWGGEFEFDNNRIILHKEMGREAPTVLEYGRNIVSLEYEELIDGVYTSIYPYAIYTPRSEDNRQQEPVMVTLDELIVDSEYAGNYETRRIQIVDFSNEFDSNAENPEIPTQAKLRTLAKAYVKNNGYGIPKISQEIDFVDLSKTLDYQDIQVMEEIELNDRVPVYYPNIDAETNDVKVTTTNWDVLNNRYSKITLSTIGAMNSNSITSKLNTAIKDLKAEQKKINNTVPYLINGQGNRVWWTTPDDNMEHKIDDTWFKKNGKYTIIYRWNGSMWEEVLNEETFVAELEAEIQDAISKAEEAKSLAVSEAENALAQAKADATAKANAIKEQISGEVSTAISTAESAKALATSEAERVLAQAKDDATTKANAVKEEVSNSVSTAINTANDAKQTAIDNYNNAVAEAARLDGEQTTAFDTKFSEIEGNVDVVSQSVSDADAKAEAIKQGLGLSDITLTNQQITEQIMSDYNTVKQNSTNALTDAGKALTDAYNAQQDANKAIEDFETFLTSDFASVENDITTAQTTATDALNKAGTAVSDLNTFKIDYNTFITDQFNPALTTATDALSLAEQNEGLFYSANLIDGVTGQSNVYTKAEIDGTNGYVSKSTFTQNAESVSSELERVEGVALSSGANINLLITRNQDINTWLDANPSGRAYPTPNDTTNQIATSPDLISVTPGEKITLSKTTTPLDNYFRIDYLDANKKYVNRYTQNANVATITIPANVAYLWVSYPLDSYPKIERGEVKTQWTLAPQDQVNQSTVNYLTSKIEQTPELISEALLAYTPTDNLDDTVSSYLSNSTTKTAGAIDTKLTSYAKTTDLNGLATETFAVNKATETANGVKNELIEVIGTKVDSDTLDGYVSTATYEAGVEGITSSISTVEGKIPTAIGGRNLLRGTANFNTPLWRNVSTVMPSTRDSRYKQVRVDGDYTVAPITTMATQNWNFEVGQDYVVSVYAKSEALGNKLGLTAQGTPYFEPQVVAVSEWRRFVWKFKATISNLANFRFETRNDERVWITQPQVEKGTILTDWTLAPEDLQTIDALDSNIVSLYNNTSSETSKAFSRTLTAYTPTSELDNKTKNYLTNNNYQTAEMVATTLTAYTPTNSLDNKTQAYLTSKQYQTASEVSTTLGAYTKTDNLDNTVASYLNSSTSQTAGAIATKLTAYTPTTSLDAKTQSYLTNNSYQTAQMVENKLASYQTKTDLDGSVASILDNTESQTAGRINSKLTDIQAQIPTEFGGRNLLRGTADFDTYFWRNVSTAIPSSRDSRYKQVRVDGDFTIAPITTMSVQGWNFEVGQEYTISVWAKSEELGNKLGVTAQSTPYFEPQVVALSEWRRYVWTFTATMSNLTNFRFETRNGEKVWITQPQIEKGSVPSDWNRAVEDTATVVQTNEIERTANYTKSAITNVTKDGLVTGSTVNQTKDGITERVARLDTNGNVTYANRDVKLDSIVSTVANDKYISNIIQASDLVQSTIRENTNVDLLAKSASGTGMTADPNFNKGINGLTVYDNANTNTVSIYRNLTNDPTLPSGKGYRLDIYHASSTATSPYRGGVALPIRSWANGTVVVRFTAQLEVGKSFEYRENSIGTGSTNGWLTSNQGTGKWEQYAYYYRFGTSGTFDTFGFLSVDATSAAFTWRLADFDIINLGLSSQSQITQLQDNINLKVSNEDLLSQINLQAEGVLIQSGTNKLNVTPETTFIQDATIQSAMIHSIDVGKITGIEADFTKMVTKGLTADVISATMIHGNDALFEKLFATSLATDKLASQEAWIKDANIISLDASTITTGTIDAGRLNAGAIVTAGLSADIIQTTHIKAEAGLVGKLFSTTAYIEELTNKSIFTEKIQAIELDAGKITSGEIDTGLIDAGAIVTAGLSADAIQTSHIKAEVGLIDKIFSEDAYIEELTNKTTFSEKIQAIEINASKITSGKLDASKIEVSNLDASSITTGNLKSINIVNTISYPSDGRTYTGDMTIAGGQISSYVTAGADYFKSILLTDRSIRLSNQDATMHMRAGNITFDGTLTGGGQIWYQDNLARLVAGSYNGFALATYRNGSFANRLSVGGWAGEELEPFVDVHARMNMRYQNIENINALVMKASEGKTGAMMYATSDNNLALGGTWGTVIGQLSSDGTTIYEFLKADQVSDRVRFAKNINMQGNTILNQSDERLKHNIYDLERDDLSILKEMRYKNFTFNNQDKETFGFIAQDLQRIMPSLIMEETDGYLSYDSMEYTHFIGHALQQHVTNVDGEITQLKSQIASLQDELAQIKGDIK